MPKTVIIVAFAVCALLIWSLYRSPSDDVYTGPAENPTPTTVFRFTPQDDLGIDWSGLTQEQLNIIDRQLDNTPWRREPQVFELLTPTPVVEQPTAEVGTDNRSEAVTNGSMTAEVRP